MEIRFRDFELTIDESCVDASPLAIRRQITEYTTGDRRKFDLDVHLPDSYTGDVMREMLTISYGQTSTYGEIADRLKSAPRAVGQACGRNPVPIIVPCHRVVGASSLGGFSSGGDRSAELKRALLELERATLARSTNEAFDR